MNTGGNGLLMNIIYINCEERYEDIVDHRSYTNSLSIYWYITN